MELCKRSNDNLSPDDKEDIMRFSRLPLSLTAFARAVFALALLASLALPVQARSLPDFTELAEKNSPMVVNISTTGRSGHSGKEMLRHFEIPDLPENHPFNELFKRFLPEMVPEEERGQAPAQSLGSGLIISDDGYILTNHHVVRDAEEILVRLNDRRQMSAELIGSDRRSDIALLKIEAEDLPTAKIGDSEDLKVGEWVLAIGSPFGLDYTVTAGIVSALGRNLPKENYVPFIQTDVAINPGNSGGPLFNLDGEVIGINSQIYSRTGGFMGLSFAIPMDVAMDVVRQLRDKGRVSRGWLGVLIQDVDRDLAESFGMKKPHGALVAQVVPGGPAAVAGIAVGDVIVEFNGKPVPRSGALPPMVGRTPVDEDVRLKVLRGGDYQTLRLRIGELPEKEVLARGRGVGDGARADRLGLIVGALSEELRERLAIPKGGVMVTKVNKGLAAEAGIRKGDVLLMLDHQSVEGPDHFRTLVKDLDAERRTVAVLVQRDGNPIFIPIRLKD